jgi:hypothetical protein
MEATEQIAEQIDLPVLPFLAVVAEERVAVGEPKREPPHPVLRPEVLGEG